MTASSIVVARHDDPGGATIGTMSQQTSSITINPGRSESIHRALNTEWLLANGVGGYAMGTALGVNTRRYHGLLVAATQPPVGRVVALHSIIEQIVSDDDVIDLSTQQFGENLMLHPAGWQHLKQFQHHPGQRVRWLYQIGPMRITRTLEPYQDRNGIILNYTVEHAQRSALIRLRPFTPLRDFHALSRGHEGEHGHTTVQHNALCFRINNLDLQWFGQVCDWRSEPQWWHDFAYARDRERGQEWREHVWSPGCFECRIQPGVPLRLSFAIAVPLGKDVPSPPAHRVDLASGSDDDGDSLQSLRAAAQQFIVHRRMSTRQWSTSVLAGYPWFGDWGRDTMIALPGLMLCTGRFADAQQTLLTFARHLRNGLIPNLFDDYGGAAHYNTVDASLWFVHAAHELWKAKRVAPDHAAQPLNRDASSELLSACRQIVEAYRHGTDFNIRMDEDGLINAGDESTQLTWMDAKRDGVVFTARHGKAVEINALWFNALHCVADMTEEASQQQDLHSLAARVAESFQARFWWEQRRCLRDVVHSQDHASEELRPNQIFAVSLPFSPLTRAQQRAVVKTVGDRLLTPFGLRTLDRDDPKYCGRYEGDLFARDRAYHNGTVWPWLLGPYCEAVLRVEGFGAAAKRRVRGILQPLLDEMNAPRGGCLNQIAEVYDGDEPHRPSGCPAQAWSVAEVLRIATLTA